MTKTIGLIGGRGYAGREILRLIHARKDLKLAFAVSSSQAGAPLSEVAPEWSGDERFEDLSPEEAARRGVDALILATPNGEAGRWVAALDAVGGDAAVIDISADHRFDDAWVYGLPERGRDALRGARRIANPGCYATALQLAAAPFAQDWARPPHAFAVSGWSGAGATPNDRNDPKRLEDNILPYAGVGHLHEREASRHLGFEVRLSPHVAPFFRGIVLTLAGEFRSPVTESEARERLARRYGGEPMIWLEAREAEARDAVGVPWAVIGAPRVSADGARVVLTCAIDNLLKGAASQALQNVNLALGLDEFAGLEKAR